MSEVAAAMGYEGGRYRTFVRRFHDALAALRTGLKKRGIKERPPWRRGVSGHALGDDGE